MPFRIFDLLQEIGNTQKDDFNSLVDNISKSQSQNLDEILQVGGLDAIIVGPYDLSASMGIAGEFDS